MIRVHLCPYVDGHPTFVLEMTESSRVSRGPQTPMWYRFFQLPPGSDLTQAEWGEDVDLIFQGDDFGCSPLHATDSAECVRGLLSFLTLRPGDTDAEYFEEYIDRQKLFCRQHAEALSMYALEDESVLSELRDLIEYID